MHLFYFVMHASVSSKDIFSFSDRLRFLYLRVTHLADEHPRWQKRDDQVGGGLRVGSAGQSEVAARPVGRNLDHFARADD